MKKFFSVLIAGAFLLALTACAPDQQTTDDGKKPGGDTQETFEEKVFDGIDAVFDESLGYYNEHPSVIQEGATRWLFLPKAFLRSGICGWRRVGHFGKMSYFCIASVCGRCGGG